MSFNLQILRIKLINANMVTRINRDVMCSINTSFASSARNVDTLHVPECQLWYHPQLEKKVSPSWLVSEESHQLTMLSVEASHELLDTSNHCIAQIDASADSRTLSFTMGEFPYEN